ITSFQGQRHQRRGLHGRRGPGGGEPRILATNSELVGAVTRSCKDRPFLPTALLARRALEIALAPIGPRKKCKMGSLASGALAEGSGSAAAQPGGSKGGGGGSRQFTRQRITRVNRRDLLFCLENERETGHSDHFVPQGALWDQMSHELNGHLGAGGPSQHILLTAIVVSAVL
ncbi:hypothetical protein NHX12_017377, partial [Muraenolepis orangiensis]